MLISKIYIFILIVIWNFRNLLNIQIELENRIAHQNY